jgi:hypothetical protein
MVATGAGKKLLLRVINQSFAENSIHQKFVLLSVGPPGVATCIERQLERVGCNRRNRRVATERWQVGQLQ